MVKNTYAGIVLLFILALGVDSSATTSAVNHSLASNAATPVELGADVNSLVFTGVVKKIPDGTALVTNTTTYLLTGGNFESIVGKEVNIIGKIIKEGSHKTIHVARAQLARE